MVLIIYIMPAFVETEIDAKYNVIDDLCVMLQIL